MSEGYADSIVSYWVMKHGQAIEERNQAILDRDEAREAARHLARFLREWDGLAECRGDNAGYGPGTPEFDLYVLAVIADETIRETEWLTDSPPEGVAEERGDR